MKPLEFAIPGHDNIKLFVWGVKIARTLADDMAQAYYVERDGEATPRCDLTPAERAAVAAFLAEHWPQHAKL